MDMQIFLKRAIEQCVFSEGVRKALEKLEPHDKDFPHSYTSFMELMKKCGVFDLRIIDAACSQILLEMFKEGYLGFGAVQEPFSEHKVKLYSYGLSRL